MEKEQNLATIFGMEISSEHCYFHPNWEMGTIDQNDPFESALSSMVSSPTAASNGGDAIPGDRMMIRELIGRLGSICDSAEISPQSCINSTNTSCYSTPLNSPPKRFNLSPLITMQNNSAHFPNPGFLGGEMGNNNYDVRSVSKPENGEIGDSREGSSVSEMNPIQNHANSKKRKSNPKPNVNEQSKAKRSKTETEDEEAATKENANKNNNKEKEKDNDSKKDYIHVRARRGQATDSHSLAERVRREKISERMKFLQDLVPGCNKVTGKATVLDEIINYVQSLQRQVEFLSMKISTVSPRMDVYSSRGSTTLDQTMYPMEESSGEAFPLICNQSSHQMPIPSFTNGSENPFPLNPLNATGFRRSIHGFGDSIAQLPNFWGDDLQSIVQMGIAQNHTQSSIAGNLVNGQMKVEL